MSNLSGTSEQVISLPKGGGCSSWHWGEVFARFVYRDGKLLRSHCPPPGRNSFQPQLNLVYSSGNGNGPFGLGWSLSIPGISRKTSKGIPLYDDEHDTFILSGAEDLVPVSDPALGITRYHPRTEGLFARIQHYRDTEND